MRNYTRLTATLTLLFGLWLALAVVASAAPNRQDEGPQQNNSTICVNAFLDENGNGVHETNEGFVTDVTLTVAQGFNIVGQGVSTGTLLPVCFTELAAGEYQVAQLVSPVLDMTTQGNITVQVGENETVGLEFGSRLAGQGTAPGGATAAPEIVVPTLAPQVAADESGLDLAVVIGLTAIVLGLIMMGLLIYVLLRR